MPAATLWRMAKVRRHPRMPWLALIDLGDAVTGLEDFLCAYVLRFERTALVDVGPARGIPVLLDGLRMLGVSPEEVAYVLTTHIHLDHGGGVGTALRHLPNAAAVAHPSASGHLERPWKLWESSLRTLGGLAEAYGQPEPVPPERLLGAEEGMKLDLGDGEIEVLLTPGHAPHHVSFMERRERVLLAGELAGVHARGIRRPATPPPLYLEQQLDSMERAFALGPSVLCYGHYGWESKGESRLRAHRRQLLRWRDLVDEGLRAGLGREEMAGELVRQDRALRWLADLPEAQYRREMDFILNSVAGFTSHLERAGLSASSH
ncbi:MAG: MBL fold metallo-hydrolase [Chloroflexota bacterium]